jgi:hypothetical protein
MSKSKNGAGPIVSVHVFTFRSPRDAGRSLVRDRSRLAQVPGLRFARLIFVGARRGEAMTPGWIDPRRQMAMCVWNDDAALDRFRERSPLGRAWRGQTDQHCEVRATPFRTHGTYRGLEPLAGLPAQATPGGPIAMLTFANIPVLGLVYFYRGIHRSNKSLLESDGLIGAVGGPERLGRGGMTFTLWDSLPDALGFSYRREPHRGIVNSVREHGRLIDSMFIRARPYMVDGDWFPWSRFAGRFADFARSMPSAPAPAPPAATPHGPAFHFRTA